jgi:transposase InsO family protein
VWVCDFTYLRCWEGRAFFSFVVDVFSRMVVGWQFASHMRTDLALDALRMALGLRRPGADVALVHHSDAGSQIALPDRTIQTARARRRHLLQIPARLIHTSRTWTLRMPARWPWQTDFATVLDAIRAVPALT